MTGRLAAKHDTEEFCLFGFYRRSTLAFMEQDASTTPLAKCSWEG